MRKLMLVLVALAFAAVFVPRCAAKDAPEDPQQPALSSMSVEELEKHADLLRVRKDGSRNTIASTLRSSPPVISPRFTRAARARRQHGLT